MVIARKCRVPPLAPVGCVLERTEPLHQYVGRFDRVHARLHFPHMGGAAGDGDPGPYDADLGHVQGHMAGARLGYHHRVGRR